MSVVTNVVVVVGIGDRKFIDHVNEFTKKSRPYGPVLAQVDPCGEHVGGGKCLEVDVYIGAFNHLQPGLIEHLDAFTDGEKYWANETVVVINYDDETTEVWRPGGEEEGGT